MNTRIKAIPKEYKAIKIFDSSSKFRENILSDFERKNKGYFFERSLVGDDGQIFIYRRSKTFNFASHTCL
mgnify:CR=1 FL=1